jgi:hypothetical protein
MKSRFLIITIVLISLPFLIQNANASQFNGTCPNNHGGIINTTDGFTCVSTGNTTDTNFDPWFNITHTKPPATTGHGEGRANIHIPDNNIQAIPGSEIMPPGVCVDNSTDCGQ